MLALTVNQKCWTIFFKYTNDTPRLCDKDAQVDEEVEKDEDEEEKLRHSLPCLCGFLYLCNVAWMLACHAYANNIRTYAHLAHQAISCCCQAAWPAVEVQMCSVIKTVCVCADVCAGVWVQQLKAQMTKNNKNQKTKEQTGKRKRKLQKTVGSSHTLGKSASPSLFLPVSLYLSLPLFLCLCVSAKWCPCHRYNYIRYLPNFRVD